MIRQPKISDPWFGRCERLVPLRLLQIRRVLWIKPWHWLRFAQVFEAEYSFHPLRLYYWP